MLASTHKNIDQLPEGMLWSIKYDGMRAFWVPTTRGLPVHQVPFCNDPVHERICTGLFSRYGKVIHAPRSFLDQLPDHPLDGELYTGRNDFQRLISICRAHNGDWSPVSFRVFDCPRYLDLFTDGRINNNIVKEKMIVSSHNSHLVGKSFMDGTLPFRQFYKKLMDANFWNTHVQLVEQTFLTPLQAKQFMNNELELGGEGVIGRKVNSVWVPKRTSNMAKVKPTIDDEAVVINHLPGEGKYVGMLGAYLVSWKGKEFKLSGMNDYDRQHPLVRGTTITFRYRTLTTDGYPREARFVREFIIL